MVVHARGRYTFRRAAGPARGLGRSAWGSERSRRDKPGPLRFAPHPDGCPLRYLNARRAVPEPPDASDAQMSVHAYAQPNEASPPVRVEGRSRTALAPRDDRALTNFIEGQYRGWERIPRSIANACCLPQNRHCRRMVTSRTDARLRSLVLMPASITRPVCGQVNVRFCIRDLPPHSCPPPDHNGRRGR